HHVGVEPRAVDRGEASVVQRLHVDAVNLGANLPSQALDLHHGAASYICQASVQAESAPTPSCCTFTSRRYGRFSFVVFSTPRRSAGSSSFTVVTRSPSTPCARASAT